METKCTRKLLALLLTATVTLSCLSVGAFAENGGPEASLGESGTTQQPVDIVLAAPMGGPITGTALNLGGFSGDKYYNSLTGPSKEIYQKLQQHLTSSSALNDIQIYTWTVNYADMQEFNEKRSQELNSTSLLVEAAQDALLRDHPDICWLYFNPVSGTQLSLQTQSAGQSDGTILATYTITYEPVAYPGASPSNRSAVNSKINGLYAGVSGSNDYEKLQSIYGIVARNLRYVTNVDLFDPDAAISAGKGYLWSAAAILEGEAVCEGYAKTFKLLCDKAGIPCVLVSGVAYDRDGNPEPHMWNYVRVDGDWYAVDITWDDAGSTARDDYFLVGADTVIAGMAFADSHEEDGDFTGQGNVFFSYPTLEDDRYTYTPGTEPPPSDGSYNVSHSPNELGWYNRDIVLTPTGDFDGIAGNATGPFAGSYTVGAETGDGSITIYLQNSATSEVVSRTFSFKLDKTPPAISTDFSFTQAVNEQGGALRISVSDSLSGIQSKSVLDAAGNPLPYDEVSDTFAVSHSGAHRIVAVDNAGNRSEAGITVTAKTIDSIALSPASIPLGIGGTQNLTATVDNTVGEATPDLYTLAWSSSNPWTATVDTAGKVTAIAPGRSVITASALGVTSNGAVITVSSSNPVNSSNFNTPSMVIDEDSLPTGMTETDGLALMASAPSASDSDIRSVVAGNATLSSMSGHTAMELELAWFDLDNGTISTVEPSGPVQITVPLPAGTTSRYRFAVMNLATGQILASSVNASGVSFTVDHLGSGATFVIAFAEGSGSSGSGGGGSSGGGGGGTRISDQQRLASTSAKTTLWMNAADLTQRITAAKAGSLDTLRIMRTGTFGIQASALASAQGLRVDFDTLLDNVVQTRVSIPQPQLVKQDLMVSGAVSGDSVDKLKTFFQRWYSNKVAVIRFDQQGAWGQPVMIAAKVDLTGMDAQNLVLYTYDVAANQITRLVETQYWVDANGYLRFTTERAGSIIVSEGVLTLK